MLKYFGKPEYHADQHPVISAAAVDAATKLELNILRDVLRVESDIHDADDAATLEDIHQQESIGKG
jgi:hypothetical protein